MGEWKFLVALLMLGRTLQPAETVRMCVSVQLIVRAHGSSLPEVCFHLPLISALKQLSVTEVLTMWNTWPFQMAILHFIFKQKGKDLSKHFDTYVPAWLLPQMALSQPAPQWPSDRKRKVTASWSLLLQGTGFYVTGFLSLSTFGGHRDTCLWDNFHTGKTLLGYHMTGIRKSQIFELWNTYISLQINATNLASYFTSPAPTDWYDSDDAFESCQC